MTSERKGFLPVQEMLNNIGSWRKPEGFCQDDANHYGLEDQESSRSFGCLA